MTDDQLFEALSEALAPAPRQPPAAAVLALRRAVVENRPIRSSPARWRRRLVAVTVMVPVALGGSTAAYALTGAVMPEPVRAAASAVGLPVDSVALADVRSAEAKLKDGLRERDHAAVAAAATRLPAQLSHLTAGDRHRVEPEVSALLGEADHFDAQHRDGSGDRPGSQGSPPTSGDRQGGTGSPGSSAGNRGGPVSPPTTSTAGHDGGVDHESAPTTGPAGHDGGDQASPPTTGPALHGGDNAASMRGADAPGGAGG